MHEKFFNLMDLINIIECLIVLEYEIDYSDIEDNIDTIINFSNNYFDKEVLYFDWEYKVDFIKDFEPIKIRIFIRNSNYNVAQSITLRDIEEYRREIWIEYNDTIKKLYESFANYPKLKSFLNFLIHRVHRNNYTGQIPIYEIFEKYSYIKRGIPDLLERKNNAYILKMSSNKYYHSLKNGKFN